MRSSISSAVLISRASSIACWPSTTSMPSASSARSMPISIMSMPSGSLSMPYCTSAFLICLAKSCCTFIEGGIAPCMVVMRRGDIVRDPRRGNALGGRRRVPQERLSLGRAERVAEELVARPFADMGRRDITDVVEIEAEYAAEAGVPDCLLRPLQTLHGQAMVVNPLFPVLGHHAPGGGRMRTVVFHGSSLISLTCDLRRAKSWIAANSSSQLRVSSTASAATGKRPNRRRRRPGGRSSVRPSDHARRDELAFRRRHHCGLQRMASVERIATCGALMIGAVNVVPKAPLLLIE